MRFSMSKAPLPAISLPSVLAAFLSVFAACDTSAAPAGTGAGGSPNGVGGAGGNAAILSPGGLAILSSDQGSS